MLEECGLPYNVHKINIGTNREQFAPEYLKINPNGKIPSIVDPDGPGGKPIAMMESGAILIYLAEKTGKFFPEKDKYVVLQWLMFQMGGVGPMFGQAHHFMRAKKDEIPYGSERYGNEAKRLYGVMDKHLRQNRFFVDGRLTVADLALYAYTHVAEQCDFDLSRFPAIGAWLARVAEEPGYIPMTWQPELAPAQ